MNYCLNVVWQGAYRPVALLRCYVYSLCVVSCMCGQKNVKIFSEI